MNVWKVTEGLWHWSVSAPDGREVVSTYYEAPSAVVLVDPEVPEEGDPEAARFWRALDRDVARLGRPVVVVLADPDRARSAERVLARYRDGAGCRVLRTD
jgi:hypothetical protein